MESAFGLRKVKQSWEIVSPEEVMLSARLMLVFLMLIIGESRSIIYGGRELNKYELASIKYLEVRFTVIVFLLSNAWSVFLSGCIPILRRSI